MEEKEIEDNYIDEDDDSSDVYYICNSCGYTCQEYHGGWGCPRCTAIMEEQHY